jgi:outer membrane receptor for ferrienterochelin and colicin
VAGSRLKYLLLIFLLCCFPNKSVADSASDEQIMALLAKDLEALGNVVFTTSSRMEVPFDEAIGTAYSLDRDTIKRRGYQSLKDLLEHIPGFVILHRDVQYVAGVRGLNSNDNQKLTLMVNGYETIGVHEPDFLNGPINLDDVERVEVVVGPSSFFEPANTLAATVNVITRKVEGTHVTFTTGSDVNYRSTFETGKEWQDDIWASASLSVERREGFSAFDERIAGTNLQATEGHLWVGASDPQYNMVAQGQYKNWSAQFQAYETRRPHLTERGAFTSDSSQPHRENLSIVEKTYSASIRNDQEWSDHLKTHVVMRIASRIETKSDFPTTGEDELHAYDYNLEFGAIYTTENHLIQTGIQTSIDDYVNFTDVDDTEYLNGSAYAVGLYASDTWQISEKLKSVLGLRADRNTVLPSHRVFFGGRAALVYEASDNWTTKLMGNHVVKMPVPMASRQELWGINNNNPSAPSFALQNNTADKPEKLTTIEWQNILYFDDHDGRASITLYHQYLHDFISWGGPWTNLGDFNGNGIEGDVKHRLNETIENWMNFSWIDSEFDADNLTQERHVVVDDEDRLIGSPRLTINAGTSIEVDSDVFLSPSIRYMAEQSASDIQTGGFKTISHRYYLDAALLWNDAFSNEKANLSFRIRNVLNNRDYISGSWLKGTYRPRGIHGNISLEYKF